MSACVSGVQRQFSRQKTRRSGLTVDVISADTTRSFTFTLNATGDGNWYPCRRVLLSSGLWPLAFGLWSFGPENSPLKRNSKAQRPKTKDPRPLCLRYFPASLCTQSAFVCISGRNASRGTVVSICMLSSVLIFAPNTAGASFDSSHTYQDLTSDSLFKLTRANSSPILLSAIRSCNRSKFNGVLLPTKMRSFPFATPPT